jgi:hypothetical protein
MTRFASWLAKNADAAFALVLSLVVAIITVVDIGLEVDADVVSGATLLVLGLVATSLLRDRRRRQPVEAEVTDTLRESSATLDVLSEKLTRVERFEETLAGARQALDDAALVQIVSGGEVGKVLADARRGTDRWFFKGGTGTYIRARTLPDCVEAARQGRRTLLVRLEIIDPTDPDLCDGYARHRRSVSDKTDATGEPWTLERTRKEGYATILAACWYRQRFRLLDIDIGLSATMTTLRYDLSATCLVITRDDPQGEALVVTSDKFYYSWCSAELVTSLDQARRVPIERAIGVPLGDEPTTEEVRRLFTAIGIELPRGYTDRDVADVIRKALRAKDPFD